MFSITYINKPVKTTIVRVDDTIESDPAAHDALQCGIGAIWNDFRKNLPMPFENAEGDGFTRNTPASFFNQRGSEDTFIDFDSPKKGDYVSKNTAMHFRIARK